jgi:signal transduction histidine kinase
MTETLPTPLPTPLPGALPETLRAGADRPGATLDAAQRRLRRLALDLHDGPTQDVAALAADAGLLRAALAGDPTPEELRAARSLADELRERLVALAGDLRDLAAVLEPRSMLSEPLGAVLERRARAFSLRTGIEASVDVDEELGVMTASQQIALVRVAQEALANAGEHAGATSVSVEVRATARGVSLRVEDDGVGFDVEAASRRAAAEGRLGLAGMAERLRFLGGTLAIDSRPGGPTRVCATIPHWRG